MYRLAVCEDEEQVRGALCALCSEILGGWGVEHSVSAFSRADELESALSAGERFDLLCLDILMAAWTDPAALQARPVEPVPNSTESR